MNFFSPIQWIAKKMQRREMAKKGLVQPKNKKRRSDNSKSLAKVAEKSKIFSIFIMALVWAACLIVLTLSSFSKPMSMLVINQKAPNTIYSEFTFSYNNNALTLKKKNEVLKHVPLVYRLNSHITDQCVSSVVDFINYLNMSKNKKDKFKLSKNGLSFVSKISPKDLEILSILLRDKKSQKTFINTVKTTMFFGVIDKEERFLHFDMLMRIFKENIKEKPKKFSDLPIPDEAAEIIAQEVSKGFSPTNRVSLQKEIKKVLSFIIVSNLVYDNTITQEEKLKTLETLPPVKTTVKKGDIIVSKDATVNNDILERHIAYIKEMKKQKDDKEFYREFASRAILCLFILIISCFYLNHFYPDTISSNHKMGLIAVVLIIAIFANYLTIYYFNQLSAVFNLHPILLPTFIPIAMAPVILSPMLGLRVSHFAGLFISIMAAMLMNNSFEVLMNSVIICSISAYVVRHRPNHPAYFMSASLIIGICVTMLSILQVLIVGNHYNLLYKIVIIGFANGIITAIVSLCFLFVLENIFQISSDMTLLLLCDYNHSLLKRLQLEAPGTYHHSLVVSTLAEHAAKSINANPIRARVIALFHDIGKMAKPEYFTENNPEASRKHNRLSPRMSSLIILNHVKEGTDLAIKNKLRKIIRDGIQQHHGTDIVFSFYKQALEEGRLKNTAVDENDFRYPGPLPKEKEVVILSLADPIEAASRSMQKPTPTKIDALVWEIMRKRIRNGQLNNADLTFDELNKIRESFVNTLTTMLHVRIAYPKDEEKVDDEGDLFMVTSKTPQTEHKNT
jgi:putative nucleotidyltransferase with HDIG domain